MRIALFGGTFDPVHWGHLLLAESAREGHRLDRVLFIPTGVPPHKAPPKASTADRWRMLKLATQVNPSFEVNDWEIKQKRVVYSYETIAHFRQTRPRDQLFFIIGDDMLRDIRLWKRGTALLKECHFLVAERPGVPSKAIPAAIRRQVRTIVWPAVALASQDIRNRVRQRRSIRYQVPEPVERYIRKRGLYR